MIDQTILHGLRAAVCAIGYMKDPFEKLPETLSRAGEFVVVGTGFVVRREVVITNGHVIDALEETDVPEAQRFLLFTPRQLQDEFGVPVRRVRYMHRLHNKKIDIGMIEFAVVHEKHFRGVDPPVVVDDSRAIKVSEAVAAFGFPHANALLEKGGQVVRWGPVLQQGWISAISPFQGIGVPDEFLLDLRAAPGISGAPLFRPATGELCGIVHSGISDSDRENAVTTTAFAQPVSKRLLGDWLAEFDLNRPTSD